ncbi:MAG: hypothetical protein AAGD96_31370 [Chloroflexota bacterium]
MRILQNTYSLFAHKQHAGPPADAVGPAGGPPAESRTQNKKDQANRLIFSTL